MTDSRTVISIELRRGEWLMVVASVSRAHFVVSRLTSVQVGR